MKKSNYFGLDNYIDGEEICVDPELYEDSCSSDSCNSDFDDDEYHDSGKYRADVDNIIKNHNFAEIQEGLPDFEKHPEVMQALDDLRGLIVQYKRMRSNCLDFMSSILPLNSPLRYFRLAECDLRYAAEVYEPIHMEDKAEYRKRNRVVEIDNDDDEQDYSSNSEYTENYSYTGDFEKYEENDYRDISEAREHLDDMDNVEADEMEVCEESIKSEYCEDLENSLIVANFDLIRGNKSETMEASGESNGSMLSECCSASSSSEYEDVSDDEAGEFERKVEEMTSEQQEKLLLQLVNEIEKEIGGDYNKMLKRKEEEDSDDTSEDDSDDSFEDSNDTFEENFEKVSVDESDEISGAETDITDGSRENFDLVSGDDSDNSSSEESEESSEELSESASGEEMREDSCNELEGISGEELEDESEESEGIEYESEEGSDSFDEI